MSHHKEPPFPLRLSSTGYVPQTLPPTPGILSIIHSKEISGVRGHEHTAAVITPVGNPESIESKVEDSPHEPFLTIGLKSGVCWIGKEKKKQRK
jgi:hypothetical protein